MSSRVARALRKRMTHDESALWDELKELKHQGYHFRRQAPVDAFVVDFVCFSQRLVIEVDGIQHEQSEHHRRDSNRDAHLRNAGFNVLRFSNADVTESLDGVLIEIFAALGATVRYE